MTYCLAIRTEQGIVAAADTRTNAGVDYIASYSKLHNWQLAPDRHFFLLSAGNLATTQEVRYRLQREIDDDGGGLASVRDLFEAADHVGMTSRAVQARHREAAVQSGADITASFIVGGEVSGARHGIRLVYPEGNSIEASADTPYLQLGENKYGKPVLDRFARSDLPLHDSARLALVSMDATLRSNITVGPPVDLLIHHAGSFGAHCHQQRLEIDGEDFVRLREHWQRGLEQAFRSLPAFGWEPDR